MTRAQQSAGKSFETILTSNGFNGDIAGLMAAVQADEKLSKLKPEDLQSAILSTLKVVKENPDGTTQLHISELSLAKIREFAGNISSGVYERPLDPDRVKSLHDQVAVNDAAIHARHTKQPRSHVRIERSDHWLKVNKALGWVGAAMMTLGAASSAQAILSKDETGERKINFTPLLWTLLQGTMAAGILYLTYTQPATSKAVR